VSHSELGRSGYLRKFIQFGTIASRRPHYGDIHSGFPRQWGSRTLGDSVRSTFLFALPTWLEGAGRLVDFGDSLTEYNRTAVPGDPDARATAQDWLAVGDYLRWALWRYTAA
jgi:hypothetical protein